MRLNTYVTYEKIYSEDIKQDLIFQSNASNILDVYFYDENDALVDITGAIVYFIVKEKPTDLDTAAVINKTITSLTAPQNGNTLIETLKAECEDLIGNYIYELRISLVDSGYDYILKNGNITFTRSIYGLIA
jgi:hypothetical protein